MANSWHISCNIGSAAIAAGTTRYIPVAARMFVDAAALNVQMLIRDTYTLSKLYVLVKANTCGANSTVKSYKGVGVGAQSVTIGAGVTGIFEDNVNSDNLVDANLICSQVVAGAGGNLTLYEVAYALSSNNAVPILFMQGDSASLNGGNTYWKLIGGGNATTAATAEAQTKYTFRVAATLSNMRVYVVVNGIGNASTLTLRKNGAPGNQTLSVGAGLTGSFEDAVNTDVIAAGNTVNYQWASGAGGGTASVYIFQMKSTSTGRQTVSSNPANYTLVAATTYFIGIEGDSNQGVGAEADAQVGARCNLIATNMYVYIRANGLITASTFRLRRNGADGALNVSVGAGATGVFEDVANSQAYIAADTLNWRVVTGAAGTTIGINSIGMQQDQPTVSTVKPYNVGRVVAMAR